MQIILNKSEFDGKKFPTSVSSKKRFKNQRVAPKKNQKNLGQVKHFDRILMNVAIDTTIE